MIASNFVALFLYRTVNISEMSVQESATSDNYFILMKMNGIEGRSQPPKETIFICC